MAESVAFEYKCRRCGVVNYNPHTSKQNAQTYLLCAVFGFKPPSSWANPPEMFDIHLCKDGGEGVADLQGYSIRS